MSEVQISHVAIDFYLPHFGSRLFNLTIDHFIDLAVLDNARFAIIKFDIE